jgi:hypothetical protein
MHDDDALRNLSLTLGDGRHRGGIGRLRNARRGDGEREDGGADQADGMWHGSSRRWEG